MKLNEEIKKRVKEFIEMNDLDYTITDNEISRFQLTSYDGDIFYIQENEGNFTLIRRYENNGSEQFNYIPMENINKLMEALSIRDKSLEKTYWTLIMSDAEYGVIKEQYNDEWYEDFVIPGKNLEERQEFNYITYENHNYRPVLNHPANTLHEISPINELTPNVVEKLYFEIHPVSCQENNERYIFKLLSNNDKVFKEYINYLVFRKKGIRLLVEQIFQDMEQYKV